MSYVLIVSLIVLFLISFFISRHVRRFCKDNSHLGRKSMYYVTRDRDSLDFTSTIGDIDNVILIKRDR